MFQSEIARLRKMGVQGVRPPPTGPGQITVLLGLSWPSNDLAQ